MSRTRPAETLIRPVKKYVKYNGGRDIEDPGKFEGKFTYYDKDKKEDVEIDMTKPIIILDGCEFGSNLMSVTGWCEATKKYHWSNEVRTINDKIVVRAFDKQKTIVLEGPYSEIKDDVKAMGLKFTRCIYFVFAGSDEINHLSLSGGSFGKWAGQIEAHGQKLKDFTVRFIDSEKGKKGTATFWSPNFDFGEEINSEDGELANEADEILQEYLDKYLKKNPEETPVYDKDQTDTDSWMFIEYEDKELQHYSIEELNTIREGLEGAGEEDSTIYQFICRAVFELQKEKDKNSEENKKEEKKEKPNPFKKKEKLNPFKKKKEEEPELDINWWKNVELPKVMDQKTLGELEFSEISDLKGYMDDDESLIEEYGDLYSAICYVTEKVPF